MAAFARYVRPQLMERLHAIGLDVEYNRGRGDALYYRDASGGDEIEVLDLIGGFGAGLLGHNHPELVSLLRGLLDAERPFHAQASGRGVAGQLGARLSGMVGRVTGREYVATFASSGTEVVEAAIKHAELERVRRGERILGGLTDRVHELRLRLRQQTARVPESLFADAERLLMLPRVRTLDDLVTGLLNTATAANECEPLYLALDGAFHGKTSGSLRLTAGREYRTPWRHLGPRTAFLPRDADPTQLRRAVSDLADRERRTYYDVAFGTDGAVTLVPCTVVNIAACFVEPIQGEGGVREIDAAYLAVLREAADLHGFALVFDEIQTGLGRTGYILASEPSGVRGDYYLFSKALGGGVAKVAALLVDRTRYVEDFGYLHTSTFADDDYSSAAALRTLDVIERDGGALLRACSEQGEYFLQELRALQARFPDQLRDVRGRGLMIGIELGSQSRSQSPFLRVLSEQNLLGFVVCGHLLHEACIRVAPTISAHGTIRLQPSAYITREAIDRCCAALARVFAMIRDGDAHGVAGFLTRLDVHDGDATSAWRAGPASSPTAPMTLAPRLDAAHACVSAHPAGATSRQTCASGSRTAGQTTPLVGFLAHFLEPEDLRHWEPTFGPLTRAECERFFDRTRGILDPFEVTRVVVRSTTGAAVEVVILAIPFLAEQAAAGLRAGNVDWVQELVRGGVERARLLGCGLVGFGGYTSIVTNACRDLVASDLALTSGNSLTTAAALEALFCAADRIGVTQRRLGVIGAAGNIGVVLAEAAAADVHELVLVGRPGTERRLRAAADTLATRSSIHVEVATDLHALRDCTLVVSATSAARPIVLPAHLGTHPLVIVDVAVPGDVDPTVATARPNAVVLRGGTVVTPGGQHLHIPGVRLGCGEIYGCLAETALLGLAGTREHFSYGPLTAANVRRIRELARTHGFTITERSVATAANVGAAS